MSMSLASPTAQRAAIGITVLRIVVGIVFIAHGAQKLFVFGHAGVTGAFTQMGVPLPALTGEGVALLEFVGGIALVLGLFTSVFAALIAIEMLGAIVFVHGKNGFFLPMGLEYALTNVAANVAISLAGPGVLALDNVRASRSLGGGAAAGSRA